MEKVQDSLNIIHSEVYVLAEIFLIYWGKSKNSPFERNNLVPERIVFVMHHIFSSKYIYKKADRQINSWHA